MRNILADTGLLLTFQVARYMQSVGGELNRKEVLSFFIFLGGEGGGYCHIGAI